MNTPSETQTQHPPSQNRNLAGQNRGNRRDAPSLNDAAQDVLAVFQEYARERPDVVAFTCLGVGFILGWKLKPW